MTDLFTQRLKEERLKHNWSQRYIAQSVGIDENTYHNYEYGNCKPSLPRLFSLAQLLDVSLDYLCGRSHNRQAYCLPEHPDIALLLSQNLKRLRRASGITQKQAAQALGLSEHAYQYYEIRQRLPQYGTFMLLADLYHTALDRLAAGQE